MKVFKFSGLMFMVFLSGFVSALNISKLVTLTDRPGSWASVGIASFFALFFSVLVWKTRTKEKT